MAINCYVTNRILLQMLLFRPKELKCGWNVKTHVLRTAYACILKSFCLLLINTTTTTNKTTKQKKREKNETIDNTSLLSR